MKPEPAEEVSNLLFLRVAAVSLFAPAWGEFPPVVHTRPTLPR